MEPGDEMIIDGGVGDRATLLRAAKSISGLHIDDLWTDCIAIDGSLSLARLKEGLAGSHVLDDHQYDVVAQALNDRFADVYLDHLVPYAREIDYGPSQDKP